MGKNFKLNEELQNLDSRIFDASKLFSMAVNSLNGIPNKEAFNQFSEIAEKLIEELKSSNAETEFEKIFIENALLNLGLQIDYLEEFTYGKNHSVEEFSKKILGEDFFEIIKNKIDSFDYKKYWEYYLSYQEYTYKQIPSNDESLRIKFNELLVELKKDILEYAKENLGLRKDYDFELILGQSFKDETFFHPTNRRMEISPYAFFVYKEQEEVKINVAAVILEIFHEIVGHGKQEANSREMPETMQDNSINTWMNHLHINFEGISQLAEKESFEFMEKFKEKYKILDDYIQQQKHRFENKGAGAFSSLYDYFKLKNLKDESFNVNEEFEKIVNNHGLAINQSLKQDSPIRFYRNSTYLIGFVRINEILDSLKKELGGEKYNENFALIDEAISTGVFHVNIWPKFVRLFLKEEGLLD